ncbi:alpha/beta hydrolase [Pseudomonas sp. LS44]|uniref:alpha/beta fold hydrolase n=1 Tax=Pseudomonas sp. LS44 TaxID=1357074 RepID=UPI00215B1AFD|nr:alpha/beta hydrolase [Pseudomonas sp. LS44]UVE18734.1 alpha/beta hydrolase [Pseudomonas sp. LS44]
MRPETAVVHVHEHYNVHTEFYPSPAARKTIILVNGSLATTSSFAQTVKYLQPQFNVVLYDQPYAGQSKPHNHHRQPISKEDEAQILLELIEHFRVDYLMSFSWGGVAALLALAQRPARIEKAVIGSFSPLLNEPMLDYLGKGVGYLHSIDRQGIGQLVNETIGKHLPSLFKRYNYRHISTLDEHEYRQMHAHIHKVVNLDSHCQLECLAGIDIPLLFVNGDNDEYTTATDARLFAHYLNDCHFATIDNTGHFLDMEHKRAWLQMQHTLIGFLQAGRTSYQHRLAFGAESQAMAG